MNAFEQGKATILAIDDDSDVLAELCQALGPAGYACHCCADGATALRTAPEIAPDLIISDINIGGQSGLALCEQLKQQPALRDVPVMFLSGAQIPDIIRRSHAAGGTYYLRKPFDPHVLTELVDKALWMPHVVGVHLARP
jgi:CheY-like chemotaxis protein